MLAQIECQEIAKRGVAHGLPPANFSAPEPWLAWPRFIQVWLDRAMGKLLRFNTAALGRNFLHGPGVWGGGLAWASPSFTRGAPETNTGVLQVTIKAAYSKRYHRND